MKNKWKNYWKKNVTKKRKDETIYFAQKSIFQRTNIANGKRERRTYNCVCVFCLRISIERKEAYSTDRINSVQYWTTNYYKQTRVKQSWAELIRASFRCAQFFNNNSFIHSIFLFLSLHNFFFRFYFSRVWMPKWKWI